MFAAQLLSLALLATGALAVPSSRARMGDRLARRAAGTRLSRPLQRVDEVINVAVSNTSHVSYSSNWAGAVWDSYPSGTFKAVTGTFTVPTPKKGSGSGSSYSASAWVGIDGDTCGTAILQTGIDFTITGSKVSYDAWYEWYPDYAYDFSGISFRAGDSVTLTVTASTTKKGSAVIRNNSSGQSASKAITSTAALCEENAEWIVEDYEEGSSLVPLANFGTVTFSNAVATTNAGSSVGPSGATLIDLRQAGTVYTSVSASDSSVTVKYT